MIKFDRGEFKIAENIISTKRQKDDNSSRELIANLYLFVVFCFSSIGTYIRLGITG